MVVLHYNKMKRILIYFLLSGLLIICSGRPSNAFEYESWPFEGMPVFRAKVDTLVLLKKPEPNSRVSVSLKVQKDSLITFPFGVKDILEARKGPGLRDEKEKPDVINERIMLKKSIQKTVMQESFVLSRLAVLKVTYGERTARSSKQRRNQKSNHSPSRKAM